MTYAPPPYQATLPNTPTATKANSSSSWEFTFAALALVALVVTAIALRYSEYLGLIVGAASLYGVVKFALEQQTSRASISTGPEMDAALVAKYNRDLEKYHRKLRSLATKQTVARASGINNAIFNVQPKPPKKPTLSTDRRW